MPPFNVPRSWRELETQMHPDANTPHNWCMLYGWQGVDSGGRGSKSSALFGSRADRRTLWGRDLTLKCVRSIGSSGWPTPVLRQQQRLA